MSRARSVPAFIVANSAPWMNGTASAKARNESVGKPGSRVDGSRPRGVDEHQHDGEDERRDRHRRLAERCAGPSAARPRRPATAAALSRDAGSAGSRRRRARLRVLLRGPLQRPARLREEDVVERRRAELDVVQGEALGVEPAHDVGEADALVEPDRELPRRRSGSPNRVEQRGDPRLGRRRRPGSHGRSAARSRPSGPPASPRRRCGRGR